MDQDPLLLGLCVWLLAAIVFYLAVRREIYNVFDPLLVANLAIPFSASLLAVYWATELVPREPVILFWVCLLPYLCAGRIAAAFFGRDNFRQSLLRALNDMRRGEIYTILCMTLLVTLAETVLAVAQGATGDARLAFGRTFRPLVLLQTGFYWFSLVLLLSGKLRPVTALTWLCSLTVLSIPFSGKGALAPLIAWYGLRIFLARRTMSIRKMAIICILVLGGAGGMTVLAYGSSNPQQAFQTVTRRFWLSGDVYILAYQRDGLAQVRGNYPVSFTAYVLHPISSLVGVRAYDKPLGGAISSAVNHEDLLSGPNPQMPVVLDFFFPDELGTSACIAFCIGLAVFAIRPIGTYIARRTRSRYLRLGAIIASLFSPAGGFVDTSQVLIALVGFAAVTILLVMLELLFASRSTTPRQVAQTVDA